MPLAASLLFEIKNESDYVYQVLIPNFETWGENDWGEMAGDISTKFRGKMAGGKWLGENGQEKTAGEIGYEGFKKLYSQHLSDVFIEEVQFLDSHFGNEL